MKSTWLRAVCTSGIGGPARLVALAIGLDVPKGTMRLRTTWDELILLSGVSRSTVARGLADLEAQGWLARTLSTHEQGSSSLFELRWGGGSQPDTGGGVTQTLPATHTRSRASSSSSQTSTVEITLHSSQSSPEIVEAPPEAMALCVRLRDLVVANGGKEQTITKRWLDAARLLLDPDHDARPFDEAMMLVEWSQRDEFWRANVLAMPPFRRKYDQLRLNAKRRPQPVREHRATQLRRLALDLKEASANGSGRSVRAAELASGGDPRA